MAEAPDRRRVGNVDFTVLPLGRAVDRVLASPALLPELGHPGLAVHFCNAYNVALARSDAAYARLLQAGDLVLSDGVPITWVGRRAYPALAGDWERVYGPDVMRMTLERSGPAGPRHYLLGGSELALTALRLHVATRYPDAVVVGAESPPFRDATAAELAERDERIRACGADLVWVGLGTPRQDVEVHRLAAALPVVALAVGAAFDFLAGTKPQAPMWVQRSGLEWAFRLASEPRRLGRRYAWGNSVFALEVARTLRAARSGPVSGG
jgi:N-acetylglucosaminyldiphosphoundecaprenol N-acetyl-beta-D-mannosaminyltransferase